MNPSMATHVRPAPYRLSEGFSLVEMAVVIFIFGLILVASLKMLQGRADAAVDAVMETKVSIIRDALIRHLSANKRLPCPDTSAGNGPGALGFTVAAPPDGIENRTTAGDVTTDCAGAFGVLPYQTLGLSRDAALDGWQNFFSYHVSAVDPTKWTISPTLGAAFPSGLVGGLTINDRNTAGAVIQVTNQAVVVLISHGKNGMGAFSANGPRLAMPTAADELENANGDATYVRRDRTDDTGVTGGATDDYVSYMTADDLLGPLYKQGSVKSPEAKLVEDFQIITDAVIAQIARTTSSTPGCANNLALTTLSSMGVPVANQYDPWGTLYVVVPLQATVSPNSPTAQSVTITSYGPNKVAGVDDKVAIINSSMIQGRLNTFFARYSLVLCP